MKFKHIAVPSRINFKYVLFHSARTVVAYLRYYYYSHRSLLSMYWIEGQCFSINSKIRFNWDDNVGNGYCCYIKLSSIVHVRACDRWFDVRAGYAFSVHASSMLEVQSRLIGSRGHKIQEKMHSCHLASAQQRFAIFSYEFILLCYREFHFIFYHLYLPCSSW